MSKTKWVVLALVGAVTLSVAAPAARAAEPAQDGEWLTALIEQAKAEEPGTTYDLSKEPIMLADNSKWALSLGVDFTYVSDYIWRGLNFSEPSRRNGTGSENGEEANYQLEVNVELATDQFGTFGLDLWLEYFSGQRAFAGAGEHDTHVQEIDYTVYWAYDIPDTPVSVETGIIFYQFPNNTGDAIWTEEAYLSVAVNDGALFGMEEGVLNPYITAYLDMDDVRAMWIEIGISHEFAMADWTPDTPVLKDITLTPSLVLGIDHRYYDKAGFGSDSANPSVATRLGNLVYGLDMTLDLSSALGIPEMYGSFSVTGFMYYSQSFHDESILVQDEFWGGVTLSWAY